MQGRAIIEQDVVSLTANEETNNVLAGTRFAPAQFNGTFALAVIASTADVIVTLSVGSDDVAKKIRLSATTGRGIESDKDFVMVNVPVMKNEQVQLSFKEVGGAVATANYRAQLLPRRGRRR
jgi:hypothetical protein